MDRIVLSDESVNVYGFRVLNAGLDISQFEKNPIMLLMHQRDSEYSAKERLPLGKWTDVKFENGQLTAIPEFDEDDELAMKVANKFEKGYLNAASIGIDIIELSEDPAVMLPGQKRPTVTKSVLTEVSIVDIPANRNALRVSLKGGSSVALSGAQDSDSIESIIPTISLNQKIEDNMESVSLSLGLKADAPQGEILAAVTGIQAELKHKKEELTALQSKYDALEKKVSDGEASSMVEDALSAGKITAETKEVWLKQAKENPEGTKTLLDSMQAYKSPTKQLSEQSESGGVNLSDVERYKKLQDEGKIAAFAKENPEEFERLSAAYVADGKRRGIIK